MLRFPRDPANRPFLHFGTDESLQWVGPCNSPSTSAALMGSLLPRGVHEGLPASLQPGWKNICQQGERAGKFACVLTWAPTVHFLMSQWVMEHGVILGPG